MGLFGSHSNVIIKTRKLDPSAEGGARILIKESDRDVLSLEKSSTDMILFRFISYSMLHFMSNYYFFSPSYTECARDCGLYINSKL